MLGALAIICIHRFVSNSATEQKSQHAPKYSSSAVSKKKAPPAPFLEQSNVAAAAVSRVVSFKRGRYAAEGRLSRRAQAGTAGGWLAHGDFRHFLMINILTTLLDRRHIKEHHACFDSTSSSSVARGSGRINRWIAAALAKRLNMC